MYIAVNLPITPINLTKIVSTACPHHLLQRMFHTCYKSEYFNTNPYRLWGESIRPCCSYQSRGIHHLANRYALRHFIDKDSLLVRYRRVGGAGWQGNKVRWGRVGGNVSATAFREWAGRKAPCSSCKENWVRHGNTTERHELSSVQMPNALSNAILQLNTRTLARLLTNTSGLL